MDYGCARGRVLSGDEVRTAVVLLPCGGSAAGGNRLWDMRSDGLVVNRLNGQCLSLAADEAGNPLQLQTCDRDAGLAGQRWTLTSEGFMRNHAHNSKGGTPCLVMQPDSDQLAVVNCPSSMQRWDLVGHGLLRNRLSGECVGPSRKGSSLLALQPCSDSGAMYWAWTG